jgi:hypothetical protein
MSNPSYTSPLGGRGTDAPERVGGGGLPSTHAAPIHIPAHNGLWYVLRHRNDPATIRLMLADMAREGYESYLPQLLRRRRPMRNGRLATKLEWVPEPLFGGYVFARKAPDKAPVRPMISLYGVEGRIAIGAVKPVVIEAIRARETMIDGLTGWVPERERRHVPAESWRAGLQPGTEVEIETCGTFLRAVVTANDGMGRLRALLDLFGRSTAITVDLPVKVRAVEQGGAYEINCD